MDDDLWGPPSYPVVQDDYCNVEPGRDFEFYFDSRLDVIEQEALNERSCMQVLKIQMEKADTEICELERHKVLLQNELGCNGNSEKDVINCNLNDAENTEFRAPNINAGQHLSLKVEKEMTKDPETPAKLAKFSNSDPARHQLTTNTMIKIEDCETMTKNSEARIACSLPLADDTYADSPCQDDSIQDLKIQQPKSAFPRHSTTNVDSNGSTRLTEVQKIGKSNSVHRACDESRAYQSTALDKGVPSAEECGILSMNKFLKEEIGRNPPQIFGFNEFLTATQGSFKKFASDMLGDRTEEEETPESISQCEEDDTTETSGSTYPRGEQPDGCNEVSTESIESPCLISIEHNQQTRSSNGKACLDKSLNENIKNIKTRSEELGFESEEKKNPLKKRKNLVVTTVNEVNLFAARTQPFVQRDSMSSLTKNDDKMTIASELKDMKVKDLRNIAKGHKLTNYHKLKKEDLIERLTNRLGRS